MSVLQRQLIINPESAESQTVILSGNAYRIGRDKKADIRLASKNVSGIHCSLLLNESGTQLLDLDSTNGTYVNSKRIKKTTLHSGDAITLGDVTLRYREERSAELPDRQTTTLFRLPEDENDSDVTMIIEKLKNGIGIDIESIDVLSTKLAGYRRNSRLLATLYALLDRVLKVVNRDAAFAQLLTELSTLLGLEIASLYLSDENSFAILENGAIEWSDEYPVVSRAVLRRVIDTGKPIIIEAVNSDDDTMRTLLKFKIRQALCFPIINRNSTVLGAVYCVSRQAGQLEVIKDDARFIEACSSFIALVLENMQMLEREKNDAYVKAKENERRRFTPIISRLKREKENLTLKLGSSLKSEPFFGIDDDDYRDVREFIEKAAPTGLPILITGETGVGKSLFAGTVHAFDKADAPFVVIDCTTIPHDLLESELFGHEKGAFTGAHARKPGKVSSANGGTLFIDEIGDLDGALQAKLLRFIQTGDYEAVGGSETHHSDARLIAATNRDLKSEVAQKRFREDLYYRLNVLTIELPPLRLRQGMILRFANHFLSEFAPRLNPTVTSFSASARKLLTSHQWPGNIRELENTVMRALVNTSGTRIDAEHCSIDQSDTTRALAEKTEESDEMDLKAARERIDRILISRALDSTGRNVSRSAELLKISRNSLMDLIKKYGL